MYRDILTYTTGKSSTKDMSLTELNVVLTELKSKGFTTTVPKTKRPNDPQSRLTGEEFSNLESDKKSQIIEMLKKWRTRTKTQNADN